VYSIDTLQPCEDRGFMNDSEVAQTNAGRSHNVINMSIHLNFIHIAHIHSI